MSLYRPNHPPRAMALGLGLAALVWLWAPFVAADQAAAKEGDLAMAFRLSSPAFNPGATIPNRHTADGPDLSPLLRWTDPPQGVKSFALICDDPDAPVGTWVHWVIYGLPADLRELPEGVPQQKELPNGARQGLNDFKRIGYNGPAPPRGPEHRYFFRLYALDYVPVLDAGAKKADLLKAMDGHTLGTAELMGVYRRK